MIIGFMPVIILFCTPTASAQFSHGRLQATGLTCALCSKSIHQALTKLSFIDSVQPELKTSSFELRFKGQQPVSIPAIRAAVEDAGFFIGGLTLNLSHSLSDQERRSKQFSFGPDVFQFLDEPKAGESLQVIGKGFLSEKDFKRMLTRYAKEIKSLGSHILLIPVKN
jgi:copper chaperone CopZ